ncbi:hypothetical protein GCM10007962_32800 [Yeosuana aromativorans]|uniref:Uncharacterized protein n=1 Tax=Yeosuana aromativorans TaxID=288019 RepID=A0A8J3FLM6_9FLAO|nr:hypothetical protein [Yeosuana aromativorans]GGK35884.1 hypothetical protein GCM10007962_32800 [Yeosuana aromativorans]
MDNDTIYKKTSTYLNSKYKLIGKKGNSGEIILSENTNQKIGGNFNFGIIETNKPQNKAFVFLSDQKIKFDSLPKLDNPTDFSLVNEFEKSTSEKNLKSVLIEKDENALTNTKAYKLVFAFIKNQKDTLGFQNTYQLIANNRFCSINYINESRENYIEMEKEFEGLALRIK